MNGAINDGRERVSIQIYLFIWLASSPITPDKGMKGRFYNEGLTPGDIYFSLGDIAINLAIPKINIKFEQTSGSMLFDLAIIYHFTSVGINIRAPRSKGKLRMNGNPDE